MSEPGQVIHRAWRDGMLSQDRFVPQERMAWSTLSDEDKELDAAIEREAIDAYLASPEAVEAYIAAKRHVLANEEASGTVLAEADYAAAILAALRDLRAADALDAASPDTGSQS